MTNCVESIEIFLACGAIGAIFCSSVPDIGETGNIQRYQQVEPKVHFVETEVLYSRKRIDLHRKIEAVSSELGKTSGLLKVVVCEGQKPYVPELPVIFAEEFLSTPKR